MKDSGVVKSMNVASRDVIEEEEEPEEDPEEEIEEEEEPEEDLEEEEEEPEEDMNEEDEKPEEDVEEEEEPEEDVNEEEEPEEDIDEEEEEPEEDIDEEEPEEDPEEEIVEDLKKDLGVETKKKFAVSEHDSENGVSNAIDNGESLPKQHENGGSSGRRRKSRWDIIQEGEASQSDGNTKRRKTRWDNNDSQNGLLAKPPGIINFLELSNDPEITRLKMKLLKVSQKLQSSEIHDKNTLIDKRNRILSELTKLNQIPKTPAKKFAKKIFVPEKEYPTYNFIGLILGPKGNTHKKMETESGARIFLRGKGSGDSDSVEEDLHVLVEANDQSALDTGVRMIEKLLVPVADLNNEHKRAQLEELAKLRRTHKSYNVCELCKEQGHIKIACPLRDSTFENACCDVCGGLDHSTANCRIKWKMDPGNLYVGYLSHAIDENRLKELFLPFGKIVSTAVIKDRSTGLSKGYGFVQFEDPGDAAAAVTYMHGYKMDGKMLAVRVAGQKQAPGPTIAGPTTMGHVPIPQVGPFSFMNPAIPGHVPIPSAQVGPFSFPGHLPNPTAPIAGPQPVPSHVPIPSGQLGPFSFPGHMPSTADPIATSNSSSGYEFSSRIPSSLPNSTPVFPGYRENPSSQFSSLLTNPNMKENQTVGASKMAETDQDSSFWSTFRFS